jgi:erythromycin esterase-like protein
MLSSAIGGLWNRYAEMQPLITFLHDRAVSGRLRLGGVDDQLGSAGAFYSIEAMPAELSALLPAGRQAECRETFRRRIYGQTGTSAAERAPLKSCLAEIRSALELRRADLDRSERLHLLDNLDRDAARDWSDPAAASRGRDRSMWLNFQWLRGGLPRGSKIIVWGATAHLSRDATAHKPFSGGGNLGAYVDEQHGKRAFFLGFTAAGGSRRWGPNATRPLTPAQPGSLEVEALREADAAGVYVRRSKLKALGRRAANVFGDELSIADWSKVIDGVVVFREERPPESVRPEG